MFDLAPFLEMSFYDFFRLRTRSRFFDTPNIKSAVLSCKSTDTTHVVAIVGKLVACKAVLARIGQRAFWVWERVQVLALPPIGTASAGKEETTVTYAGCVCARQAGIFLDVAARLRFCFTARLSQISPRWKPNQSRGIRTWSNCPPCHHRPTCYTICLPFSEHALECRNSGGTRTVLFPRLRGSFFVNITGLYLLPCRL